MLGGRSIQLARIFGIRIGVDPSWFLILFLIVWSLTQTYGDVFPNQETKALVLAAVSALLFFVSLILHELGHALVARRNGIGIAGIDLFLFGGVARLRRDADSAGVEFKVAVAGPLVTLVIVALCVGAGLAVAGDAFDNALDTGSTAGTAAAVLFYLAFINTALLLFNLIPAFPLDGGRIARAIAWRRTGDRSKATRFAARVGRGFSYVLVGLGVYALLEGLVITGLWSIVIGLFLGQAARSAERQTQLTSRIEGLLVADVMDQEPVALGSGVKLDRALEDFFLRYGWQWFPVVDGAGLYLGYVRRQAVEEVPEALRPGWTVQEVMNPEAAQGVRVGLDEPLEAVLGSEGLGRLGALMAVDAEGMLCGVVTLDQVKRALRPAAPAV